MRIAFIGSAGLPNRYGGFEAFLEHCAPVMERNAQEVWVTCDARLYKEKDPVFNGVKRLFLRTPANGALSVLHDLFAFMAVFPKVSHIVVLGVSGGVWFPFFRLMASVFGKKLLVNVDGVEWQRGKYSGLKKAFLRLSDAAAQIFAHKVVYDNSALECYVFPRVRYKSVMIPYSGDHVLRLRKPLEKKGFALTVCRIEPENNLEMLLEGVLQVEGLRYVVVGNWNSSDYGKRLRGKYAGEARLELLDPIYDSTKLAEMREGCAVYIHGHSVGGTNPSLVEMLFYDSRILCFDVPFHHATAGDCVEFFSDSNGLAQLLSAAPAKKDDRLAARHRYTSSVIANQYISACADC